MKFLGSNIRRENSVDIKFNIYKFSNRPQPEDKKKITIVSCLSEFGCETIGCILCLPRIFKERPDHYKIAVGWYGRDYFYRHLVDEFWEIKEEYQWLRDYCKAFHHESRNLAKLEKALEQFGNVVTAQQVGQIVVGNRCKKCGYFWGNTNYVPKCLRCGNTDLIRSMFAEIGNYRKQIVPIPKPSLEKTIEADKYLKENPVGIFARGRSTYGRNLQPEFYVKLIQLIESLGYNPIWLGEKQSTQPCPLPHIVDFSRMTESRDLELTCAIISKLKWTIQFWTASTRLAAFMGVPHILFESPMQIWGEGQEGFRLSLLKDMAPIKIIISHFVNIRNNHDEAMKIVSKAIKEVQQDNYKEMIGLVEEEAVVRAMIVSNQKRVGL